MELNFTTFILEIINFLVLIWLLQRFFYKPVLNVIAKRKAGIDQALAEAARVHEEAAALQRQCEENLKNWEQQKRKAQEDLQREIDERRAQMLEELKVTLENERNRNKIIEERRKADERHRNEALALANAGAFAAKLLKVTAGPELDKHLFDLLLQQMTELPAPTVENLRANHVQDHATITIVSAYPLSGEQRAELQRRLDALLNKSPAYDYRQDPELIAGLRINIGAWVVGVNLQDELQGFTQFAHE